ncbi:MAG: C13 family peptidase [Chloroflexota bacterium]
MQNNKRHRLYWLLLVNIVLMCLSSALFTRFGSIVWAQTTDYLLTWSTFDSGVYAPVASQANDTTYALHSVVGSANAGMGSDGEFLLYSGLSAAEPLATATPTPTATNTPAPTDTPTNTSTPTNTPSHTPSPIPESTNTPVPTDTLTSVPTPIMPTATVTIAPTDTPVPTETPVPTVTPIPPTATNIATSLPINTPTGTPTSISSPTQTPSIGEGDNYEPNNTCADASLITPDGLSQSHTFYTAGDADWLTFTAPHVGIYRIEAMIPDGSQADIDLFYYTDCDSLPEDQFTKTFAAGARLDVHADTAGQQFYIELKNFDDLQSGADVNYNISVRAMPSDTDEDGNRIIPGPAIVVAGRYRGADSAQDNIDQIAQDAYNLFKAKGRNDSEIYFLATDSSLPGYDGPATLRNLELAITDWAAEQLANEGVSRVLTLYLVDHGDRDKFYLDRVNQEVLVPNDLDAWLTELEESFTELHVNVIIEACHAGSFITRGDGTISKNGRVIITSSNENYDAYVSRHGAVFSDNFLTLLGQEYNLGYSYQLSRNIVQTFHRYQEPWIDANGNSTPNETEDIALASLRSFAKPGTLGDSWPPYIATVSHTADTTSIGTGFHTEVRHQGDNSDIDAVWGIVYPPDYVPPTGEAAYEDDGELNDINLDVIDFVPESAATDARYVEAEPYGGFTQMGVYRVIVHARDVNGLSAQPVTLMVTVGHQIFLPTVSR